MAFRVILTTIFLAFPVGFCVYAMAFVLSGGPLGQASNASKFLSDLLLFPLWPIGPVYDLISFCFLVGLPYSFVLTLSLFWRLRKKQDNEI